MALGRLSLVNMNLPKIVKTVNLTHPAKFACGPRVYKIEFIAFNQTVQAMEYWYHESGKLHSMRQRDLSKEEQAMLKA